VEVLAKPGMELKRGAKLAVLEAMKTQLPLTMPFDGIVESILVEVGLQVDQDATVAIVKPMENA
jgi:biotin carboxyl carrier protein